MIKILSLTQDNFEQYHKEAIALSDAFLNSLGESPKRTVEEKADIIKMMIAPETPTEIILAFNSENEAVGMSYYNEGTGYSCGGGYVWMNGIYVKPEAQKQGIGSALIAYIENWAKVRNFTLIICSRGTDNKASEKIFTKAGFEQNTGVTMEKELISSSLN